MAKEHDRLVLEAGKILKKLGGTVYADHVSANMRYEHTFEQEYKLEVPHELLAASVPTQMLFTGSKRPAFDPDWATPDLVLEKKEWRFVVDICDSNEPNMTVARKIETVIANAHSRNIVGVALLKKEGRGAYAGKSEELQRLRDTFRLLFGEAPEDHQDICRYLRILFALPRVLTKHGAVCWECVSLLTIASEDCWEDELRGAVKKAFENPRPLVDRSHSSTITL